MRGGGSTNPVDQLTRLSPTEIWLDRNGNDILKYMNY